MKKKSLTVDDMLTFFAVAECCGEKVIVDQKELEEQTMIHCEECERPLMFRDYNRLWYHVGPKVFE